MVRRSLNRLREGLINLVKTVFGQNRVKHLSDYPLHEAVLSSNYARAEQVLVDGEDVNRLDDQSMSALVWAVYRGDVEMVELICQFGADVDQRVGTGETALWHAEDDFGLWEVAAVLRRYGASAK